MISDAITRAPAALALLTAAVAIAGCARGGGSAPGELDQGTARPAAASGPCPGARVCPYGRVITIGQRGSGVLRYPEAIAVGPRGQVYVADQYSHLVQVFTPQGRFLRQWGAYGALPGQLGSVGGLAVDARGDVYVVDSSHDRVERFSEGGRLLSVWGRPGHGVGEFSFGRGQGPDKPPGGGIAVQGGHVYVADTYNNRIERFSLDGSHATVWVGPGSGTGHVVAPHGMAAAGGVLYVADDGNHCIDAFDQRGRDIARSGTLAATPDQFQDAFDVAVHGQRVYAVDDNHGRIVVLDRSLRYLAAWSGSGEWQLSKYLRAVATDAAGRVYVADTANGRIVAFDGSGAPLRQWGIPGTEPGQLITPLDVAYRPGRMLVLETLGSHSPLLVFDSSLTYLQTWLKGGGAILGSHWFSPTAAAFAPDGTVWVTDRGNGLIRHLDSSGGFLGALGDPQGTSGAGGAPSAAIGAFTEPTGVAVDAGGDVYVADTGNDRVQKLSPAGHVLAVWGKGATGSYRFAAPSAVALGPGGRVYVLDSGHARVVELDGAGRLLRAFDGARGARGARFLEPSGIAVDSRGELFVSDALADRVVELDAAGRLLARWGAPGTARGELSAPAGITLDCAGDLLLADAGNNRVQIFTHVAAPALGCARR